MSSTSTSPSRSCSTTSDSRSSAQSRVRSYLESGRDSGVAVKQTLVFDNGTAAIAETVPEGLRALGDVDVRAVGDELEQADMIVVGAPTHSLARWLVTSY